MLEHILRAQNQSWNHYTYKGAKEASLIESTFGDTDIEQVKDAAVDMVS